jgi:hypothetical protein
MHAVKNATTFCQLARHNILVFFSVVGSVSSPLSGSSADSDIQMHLQKEQQKALLMSAVSHFF